MPNIKQAVQAASGGEKTTIAATDVFIGEDASGQLFWVLSSNLPGTGGGGGGDATSWRGVQLDTTIATPFDGAIPVYRSAGLDVVWEPKPAGGSASTLQDLTNVTITAVGDGELLSFSSPPGQWINRTPSEAMLATAAQGALADSALQPSDLASGTITARAGAIDFSGGSTGHVLTVQPSGALALVPQIAPWSDAPGSMTASISGNSWSMLGNVTGIPVTMGWWGKFRNISGAPRTLTPSSGSFIDTNTATLKASVTLANNKTCFLHADGTNVIMEGGAS